MSAEVLREAAALMRERAEAATFVYSSLTMQPGQPVPWPSEGDLALDFDEDQAAHIAGMSPAVALAVADWLEAQAARAELGSRDPCMPTDSLSLVPTSGARRDYR